MLAEGRFLRSSAGFPVAGTASDAEPLFTWEGHDAVVTDRADVDFVDQGSTERLVAALRGLGSAR